MDKYDNGSGKWCTIGRTKTLTCICYIERNKLIPASLAPTLNFVRLTNQQHYLEAHVHFGLTGSRPSLLRVNYLMAPHARLDRHTPLRTPFQQAKCTLRTSLSPQSLSPRERYLREYDSSTDPFYTPTKTRSKVKHQLTANGHGALAPHYIPSFVHSRDFTPPVRGAGRQDVRYVSMDGVWSVGGRVAAVPQQIHGVDSGTGETLASGTNATMITAAFLEHETEDSKTKAHEARLALAMDIDQARRVLPVSPPTSPQSESS